MAVRLVFPEPWTHLNSLRPYDDNEPLSRGDTVVVWADNIKQDVCFVVDKISHGVTILTASAKAIVCKTDVHLIVTHADKPREEGADNG